MVFKHPVFFESIVYRNERIQMEKSYIVFMNGEFVVRESRFEQKQMQWLKLEFPPKGMAKVTHVILSKGLEIDKIKFSMEERRP